MGKKKTKDGGDSLFGDLEDSFFATGEDSDFWNDDNVEAFEDAGVVRRERGAPPPPPAPEADDIGIEEAALREEPAPPDEAPAVAEPAPEPPEADVLQAAIPEVALPEAELPAPEVPAADLPEAELPPPEPYVPEPPLTEPVAFEVPAPEPPPLAAPSLPPQLMDLPLVRESVVPTVPEPPGRAVSVPEVDQLLEMDDSGRMVVDGFDVSVDEVSIEEASAGEEPAELFVSEVDEAAPEAVADEDAAEIADEDLFTAEEPGRREPGVLDAGVMDEAYLGAGGAVVAVGPGIGALDAPTMEVEGPRARAAAPGVEPAIAPPIQPPKVPRYSPAGGAADRWVEAATALEREAREASSGERAARLFAEAGRIQFARLGNWDEAERLFERAVAAGLDDPLVLKEYADVVASRGDYALLRDLLERRAGRALGPAAAEALEDAALVERNSLRRDAAAVALLERALAIQGDDWFALRLLRELHHRNQEWASLARVMERMASLVTGPRAARLLVERGHVLEGELQQIDAARASFRAALDADPGSTPAFLALERLAREEGDHDALIDLYAKAAERSAGEDACFWRVRVARLLRKVPGRGAEAVAVLRRVVDETADPRPELFRELGAWLAADGDDAGLADCLAAEADRTPPPDNAFALSRLAQVTEARLGDRDRALATWMRLAETDPTASPAVDAVARILGSQGRHAELVAFLESHLAGLDDPNLVVTTLYRMGEICEGPLGDQKGARKWFERILDTAPGYLPALEGLERVYTRLEEWDQLAAVYEQRAVLCEDPGGIALQLHRAGAVCEFRLGDVARARDFYRRALDTVGDFPPSLDAFARILEAEGDWEGLARMLREAAAVTRDSNEVVSFTYRAARILADKVGEPEPAIAALRRCLELSPGFLPAIGLLRQLCAATGAWQDVYDLQRLEADAAEDLDRRHWRMLAAAEVAARVPGLDADAVVREVLEEDPANGAAAALLEERALLADDVPALVRLLQRTGSAASDEATRARVAALIVDLAASEGDSVTAVQAISEIISAAGTPRPLVAVARVAEGLNYWEEAQRALEGAGDTDNAAELARMLEAYHDDPAEVARAWRAILAREPSDTEAAFGVERALGRLGAREGLAEVHATLAEHLTDAPVRAVHALLAGHLFDAAEQRERAVHFYTLAFEARPCAGKAFDALRRLYTQALDAGALVRLFERLPEPMPLELAETFEDAGLTAEAAAVYRQVLAEAAGGDDELLPVIVRLEAAAVETGEWREAFGLLGRRLAVTRHREERARIEAKRRWVLAEKLADTDEAWDFYRQLHEEDPEDAEVLEALARIAGARGETGLAIQYLDGLASVATDPRDAARFHRRIAEVHLRRDERAEARQAFLRALDLHPEDTEALVGLEDLATRDADWRTLAGVLARRATVAHGDEQVEQYRRIARLWQDQIGDDAVAMDSWRKVLDLSPDDPEAVERLVDLARIAGEWESFAEFGQLRAQKLEGAARSRMQAELGEVYLKHLYREDEALRFLDAASQGECASAAAAAALERLHAARGAWDQVVVAIQRQAAASTGGEAVAHYLRAAQTRLETLHDRDGAAEIYEKVLEHDATNGEALQFLGDHLYKRGMLAEAVAVFERSEAVESARDLDDFDAKIEVALYYFRYAEALRALDRKHDAVRRYENALELNPSHLPSLEAVGPLYVATERWDDAARVYRQILQLTGGQGDPARVAATYTNLGRIELHQGSLDKAKNRFNKALELRPNDIRALQGIAAVLFARGDWNNLLNVYNNIIYHAQEPAEVVEAYLTKGFVLDARMNLPEKAAQHYDKSLAFDPAQPAALLRLGEIALRKQDWPEAASLAERGLGLDVSDARTAAGLHLVRAVAFGAVGDQGAMQDSLRAALAADVTLGGSLSPRTATASSMHDVLRARLQERL